MSDTAPETDTQQSEQPQEGEAKTFDEGYVKKLRDEAAKYRTEAKANAGAAKRLAEIEEATKSEADKAAERLAAAEREAAAAKADGLRWRIAAKFQVSDEDADLFLTGTDEETLTRQAQRLTDRDAARKKGGNHVPREGATPTSATAGDEHEVVSALFGS